MAFSRHVELEAAILANPDDDATWLVYGDWLQDQGDPRGHMVPIRMGGPPATVAKLQGGVDASLRLRGEVTWHRGHWLTIDTGAADLGPILENPASLFLRELRVVPTRLKWDRMLEALLGGPQTLRVLRLGEGSPAEPPRAVDCEDFSLFEVLAKLGGLELVDVCGPGLLLEELPDRLPGLRVLRLRLPDLASEIEAVMAAIEDGFLEGLEELELWLGNDDLSVLPEELEAVTHGDQLPELRRLALVGDRSGTADLLMSLADAPITGQLTHLDVSWGNLATHDLDFADIDAFEHLEELNLDCNQLDEAVADELEEMYSFVRAQDQRDPEADDDDHYEGSME